MTQFQSYAKLRAIQTQRLMPVAEKSRTIVMHHAVVLSTISLRGYASTLHAFQFGSLHSIRTSVHGACKDPRTDQEQLLSKLETELIRYCKQCEQMKTAPQIWIANKSALRHLQAICDRICHTQTHTKLAAILQFILQRYEYAASQTLLSLTSVLQKHWRSYLPDEEEESLEAWNAMLQDNVAPIQEYHTSTCLSDEQEASNPIRKGIASVLRKEASKRWTTIAQTLLLFSQKNIDTISCFSDWWQQDLQYFTHFCRSSKHTKEDNVFLAAQKFEEREFSYENYLWDLRREDSAFFYASLLEGHCMEGEVLEITGQTMIVGCNQPILRAREGDALSLRNDPVVQFRVLDSEWTSVGYIVTLHKSYGKIPCSEQRKVQLSPSALGWNFQSRRRQNIKNRLHYHSSMHQKEDG